MLISQSTMISFPPKCCGPNTNPPSHLKISESLRQSLKMSEWANVHFFILFYFFSFLITSGDHIVICPSWGSFFLCCLYEASSAVSNNNSLIHRFMMHCKLHYFIQQWNPQQGCLTDNIQKLSRETHPCEPSFHCNSETLCHSRLLFMLH